jgi:hypothetical protein
MALAIAGALSRQNKKCLLKRKLSAHALSRGLKSFKLTVKFLCAAEIFLP